MSSISFELYSQLQQDFGLEKAKTLSNLIEAALGVSKKDADLVISQKLPEIKKELKTELSSKEDVFSIKEEIFIVRENVLVLEEKIEHLETRINSRIDKIDVKFNFIIALLIIAITLMNPVAAELIKGFIK